MGMGLRAGSFLLWTRVDVLRTLQQESLHISLAEERGDGPPLREGGGYQTLKGALKAGIRDDGRGYWITYSQLSSSLSDGWVGWMWTGMNGGADGAWV